MAEAANFSASKSYAAGDLCLMEGILFRFTASHSGAWDDEDAEMVDTEMTAEVNMVVKAVQETKAAAEFAESLVFEPSLIAGTRYKYVLTDNT